MGECGDTTGAVSLVHELADPADPQSIVDAVDAAAAAWGCSAADVCGELAAAGGTDALLAARCPSTPNVVLFTLLSAALDTDDRRLGAALVQNPAAPAKLLAAASYGRSRSKWWMPAAAAHPSCPTPVLRRAASYPASPVGAELARNPAAPDEILDALAAAALRAPQRSQPTLRALAANPAYTGVRRADVAAAVAKLRNW